MLIPPGEFSAFLFDCDGTIADSMPLHLRAWNEAIAPWGAEFSRDLLVAWAGIPVPRTVEMLNEKFGLTMPVQEVVEDRERLYLALLPEIKVVPAVLAAIEMGAAKGVPMAVVSGSPRASVLRTLSALCLQEHFPVVVGAEDTPRGKPHPDPYLLAAKTLGVEATRCLVFEDGELGIDSARAAGMQWVRVVTGF